MRVVELDLAQIEALTSITSEQFMRFRNQKEFNVEVEYISGRFVIPYKNNGTYFEPTAIIRERSK